MKSPKQNRIKLQWNKCDEESERETRRLPISECLTDVFFLVRKKLS